MAQHPFNCVFCAVETDEITGGLRSPDSLHALFSSCSVAADVGVQSGRITGSTGSAQATARPPNAASQLFGSFDEC